MCDIQYYKTIKAISSKRSLSLYKNACSNKDIAESQRESMKNESDYLRFFSEILSRKIDSLRDPNNVFSLSEHDIEHIKIGTERFDGTAEVVSKTLPNSPYLQDLKKITECMKGLL